MGNNPDYKRLWSWRVLLVSGLLIALWGSISFVEGFSRDSVLTRAVIGPFPQAQSEALSFFFCGFGFVAAYFGLRKIVGVSAVVVLLLAALSLVFHAFEWRSGFLPFSSFVESGAYDGVFLMPASPAVFFVFAGLSLWFFVFYGSKKLLSLAVVGSVITALAIVVTAGYIAKVETIYLMSIASAMMFLLSGVTLLLFSLDRLLEENRFNLWMSLPIIICIATVVLSLAAALRLEQKRTIKESELVKAEGVRGRVLKAVQKGKDSLEHMVRVWEATGGTPQLLWEEEARFVISKQPGLEEVFWVNSAGSPEWVAGKARWSGVPQTLSKKAMKKAKEVKGEAISGIYDESGSLTGMALYLPVYTKNGFDGFFVAAYDLKKFIKGALTETGSDNYKISIAHRGDEVLRVNKTEGVVYPVETHLSLSLLGLNLDLFVEALDGVLGKRESYLPVLLVVGGGLIVFLMLFLIHYALKARVQTEEGKRALAQLRRAKDTILQQDKLVSLGTLTAGIAHEVKNPLNIMKSFSELSISLAEEISLVVSKYIQGFDQRDKESFNEAIGTLQANLVRISEQSKRANLTIQRMLAHTRGNQEAVLTDIHSLLDEYLNLSYYGFRVQDPSFNAKFTKRYDPLATRIYVLPEDLSRVFLNLFNNAYYALAQKKKKAGLLFAPELTVTTQQTGGFFEIRVRDNGCGIPVSLQDKVFTPFFTTKPVGTGTGLGLSISHSIVADHGGTLEFASKEGEFTEFHISLPAKKEAPLVAKWELAKKE